MRIAITADHNGTSLKDRLSEWLRARGHEADDRTPAIGAEPVDYPPLCAEVCGQVTGGAARFAVVVGGSGQGEQIACNKIKGIRAALCNDVFTTRIARGHNDANVCVIGAKVVSPELADEIIATWFDTVFKGGVHQRRLDQIAALERGEPLA
jgi:ribose 5-phosphate isomerase B